MNEAEKSLDTTPSEPYSDVATPADPPPGVRSGIRPVPHLEPAAGSRSWGELAKSVPGIVFVLGLVYVLLAYVIPTLTGAF